METSEESMNADRRNGNSAEDQSPRTAVRKFLFENSFDDDEEPEEVVPTFSEEEVSAARQEGFAAGKEEGIREAAEATERDILAVMGKVGEKFDGLFKVQEAANASILESALSFAVGIAHKVFPALNERNALGEVERMAVKILEHLLEEPFVTLYVNSGLLAPFEERMEGLKTQAGFKGEVKVRAAEDVAPGDCRIEWSDGGAKRDSAELWREIDKIVERNLSGEPREAEAPPQEPLDHAVEPQQPKTPEDAPAPSGADDTQTDREDS